VGRNPHEFKGDIMLKVKAEVVKTIKLQRNNKIIERSLVDYENNKAKWDFRGFKPVQDVIKEVSTNDVDKTFENETKVVKLKTKKRKTRKKK
tara:strand:- start:183 stop:458 length:276 start_codon:yes stop_codon:yes gene_type:complete